MRKQTGRWKLGNQGNAIVEFTLTFPLLFLALSGIYQFGYTFFVYNSLEAAVRSGARYASIRAYDSTTNTPSAAFLTAVRNVVAYGTPTGGTQPLVPGVTPDKISLEVSGTSGIPTQITVTISNLEVDAVFAKIQLNGKPRVAFPYTGRLAR